MMMNDEHCAIMFFLQKLEEDKNYFLASLSEANYSKEELEKMMTEYHHRFEDALEKIKNNIYASYYK